jgi:hypothetical protein
MNEYLKRSGVGSDKQMTDLRTAPIEAVVLVQRCNGTTAVCAGLGYMEVNVICPCKSLPWAVG